MPIKRLVGEKAEKNPFKHTPASFRAFSPPIAALSVPPLSFIPIQATRYHDTIISPLFFAFPPVFQCVLLYPQVIHAFCLSLTETPGGGFGPAAPYVSQIQ